MGKAPDLGRRRGRDAISLAGRGGDVTAVGCSESAIDKGRSIAKRRGVAMKWVVADLA
jgi:2-polyprenyl-3-methyl-5-hydroxy-6-metoxy-1,4-benzoquinol methylase